MIEQWDKMLEVEEKDIRFNNKCKNIYNIDSQKPWAIKFANSRTTTQQS